MEMNATAIFWIQILSSLVVFALLATWYAWPALTRLPRNSALVPLLFVHVFRYVGMTLLVAGMIDPKLPGEFLSSAAYGDLIEAALALASVFALRSRWRLAIPLVWVANTWGFVDLLNGLRGVVQSSIPTFNLGTFGTSTHFMHRLSLCRIWQSSRFSSSPSRGGVTWWDLQGVLQLCLPSLHER
jgi:hypothetical protein